MAVNKLSRRRTLEAIGTSALIGAAGCLGDDDSGDDGDGTSDGDTSLGDRVPEPLTIQYFSDVNVSPILEASAPIIEENLSELLEIAVEITPQSAGAVYGGAINDERNFHAFMSFYGFSPDRLDPFEFVRTKAIDFAGANGRPNLYNYANCEYSELAQQSVSVAEQDERRSLVNEAESIASEDVVAIPLFGNILNGIYNTDRVSMDGIGEAGLAGGNPFALIKSSPEDDLLRVNTNVSDDFLNYFKQTGGSPIFEFSNLFASPLVTLNENFEEELILAESYDISENGTVFDFQLREATFHNGDPITAQDVEFTFTHAWEHPDVHPMADPPSGYNIEVQSDSEVRFEFDNPKPTFMTVTAPRWGIAHRESYVEGGAIEDPQGYTPDEFIGSGPFQIVEFSAGEFRGAVPHPDGHPVYDPEHDLTQSAYSDESAAVEAFLNGELDVVIGASIGAVERMEEEVDDEAVQTNSAPAPTPIMINPQYSFAPFKFRALRAAAAAVLDKQLMNEIALNGNGAPELYSTLFLESHPWRPPDDMLYQMADDATGDIGAGKQILEDAGWGWDDDGDLRYPEDADLSPRWPQGETPNPEDFECLNSDGTLSSGE